MKNLIFFILMQCIRPAVCFAQQILDSSKPNNLFTKTMRTMFYLTQKKAKSYALLFLMMLSLAALPSSLPAQDYGKLEWDVVRVGLLFPSDKAQFSVGTSLSTEVRYNISNNLSASIRLAVEAYTSGTDENITDVGILTSIHLAGDYYFSSDSNNRPFVGIGLGRYDGLTFETTVNGPDTETIIDRYLGWTPRVGYELGVLRISGEYNISFEESMPNILGIHLGFTIGGKR